MPKIKEVTTLPKCDFCGADAKYDAPTLRGAWAYMCGTVCIDVYSNKTLMVMGTQFVLKSAVTKSLDPKTVDGLEPDEADVDYWHSIVVDDLNREIECPTCHSIHQVEPDADYEYLCECGDTVKVPCPAF